MASSSNWLAALGSEDARATTAPPWIAQKAGPQNFNAASPFAQVAPAPIPAPPEPDCEPEILEPDPGERELSAIEQARADGFAEGYAEGQRQAEAALRPEIEHIRALRLAFRTLDAAAIETLTIDLQQSVLALCAQVLGEAALSPDGLKERCLAAVERISGVAEQCTLHLHPLDIDALAKDAFAGFNVAPDPTLQRGGLRVSGPDSEVRDGPQDWQRAIAEALGAGAASINA
ncbi:MAG: hypothetical protein AAFR88_09110 [Pseudomonadota bacterium]